MARTREFEPNDVIEKAVSLFWEKGYADTSMDDLVKHTGVSRYGIYGEFGNKRELFLRALEHFHGKFGQELLQDLAQPEAGLPELRGFYQKILEYAKTEDGYMGCFMCNTAVELSRADALIAERVGKMFEGMRTVFLNALNNAKRHGEIAEDMDVEEYASYLVGVDMGGAMMVRAGFSEERMQQFMNIALREINNQ